MKSHINVFFAAAFKRDCEQIERNLMELDAALDNWMRCVIALETFCDGIILELENVRQNVNIASIVGSTVGLIGASLAIAGIITAPFTLGTSLGLTIAGGVVGSVGGLTSAGSKFTEMAINRKPSEQFKRRKLVFEERSKELKSSLKQLKEKLEIAFTNFDDATLVDLTTTKAQAVPGFLRTIKAFTVAPVMIIRSASRAGLIFSAVIAPLAAILDVGILAFSVYDLAKGSKTTVTENLRAVSALLRSSRIQMQIWRNGSENVK